jgi:hypothetical protein
MDGSLGERVGEEGSSLEVLSSGHEGVVSQESRDDTCDVSFVRSDVKGLKERTRDVPPNIIGLSGAFSKTSAQTLRASGPIAASSVALGRTFMPPSMAFVATIPDPSLAHWGPTAPCTSGTPRR